MLEEDRRNTTLYEKVSHLFKGFLCKQYRAFSSNFWKRPLAKIGEKMIDFLKLGKLGEINDIEHNKGSKIYSQNQVILDCIMPSIHLSTSV